MSRTRRILHLDVDAFLASVEQALHPELRGKPVVVGGLATDRNLVMSCSYESRPFGVRPGLLLPEAARRCPQAIFRRGDAQAASRLREEVARVAWDYSPRVEIASIDDLFVDLSGTERLLGRAFDVAAEIQRRVADEVSLPLTIGVGTSRTLARLAGKLGKPGGIAEIFPGGERAFLNNLPVEQLPGVGHSTARLLERFAIRTVGHLALVSREVLFASFGTLGLLLYDRARGIDPDPITPTFRVREDESFELAPPKSIRRDSTFEPEEGRREHIEAMLGYLVERAAHRLRRFRAAVGSLEVRLMYVDTRSPSLRRATRGEPQESRQVSRRKTLEPPTDSTDELIEIARGLLASLPRRRALVKRVGLTFHRLRKTAGWQGRLFSDPDSDRAGSSHAERQRTLDATLDRLREKHGFGGILRGDSALLKKDRNWSRDGIELRTPSLNQ